MTYALALSTAVQWLLFYQTGYPAFVVIGLLVTAVFVDHLRDELRLRRRAQQRRGIE